MVSQTCASRNDRAALAPFGCSLRIVQELREGLARLGAPLSKDDFDVLASRVDTDGAGKIDYSQFARAFKVCAGSSTDL